MTRSAASGYVPADFFVLRAPLLPQSTLTRWSADLEASAAGDADLEGALARDRQLLLERLRTEVETPAFREAIRCASPTLDDALAGWLREPGSTASASVPPILVRYFARMTSRATPFGLFSSCGVGRVDRDGPSETTLSIASSPLSRHTRLDMQYLTGLVESLERDGEVRAALRFWPSNGLYRVGERVHLAEAEMRGEPKARAFRLVSLDGSAGLDVALARAATGARAGEIADALMAALPDLDVEAAHAFVGELVDSQVLVSELSPPITGPEPIHHLISVLRARGVAVFAAEALERVRDRLAAMDREGIGQADLGYREVAALLKDLPAAIEPSRLFQIDLARSARGSTLGPELLGEVQRGLSLLRRIAVPMGGGDYVAFVKAFHDRYEGREVPLSEVLDDEVGIGFGKSSTVPSALLEGLPWKPAAGTPQVAWGPREAWLARRVVELAAAGDRVWELDDDDLAALETDLDVASPDSIHVAMTIATRSPEALAAGDFQLALMGPGAGAANILGRFCHADEELCAGVRAIAAREQDLAGSTILAEIVHQPEGRIGNILCRPVLRPYEIPYLARSGVDPEHQIPIDDLLVSVHGQRVRLRSKRLGRWVEPRMSTAHNPQTVSLGVYRFLCALRSAPASAYPTWDWGPLQDAPHLPRVTSGRLVLALEQWTLNERDLATLREPTEAGRFRALRALRKRLALPRRVALVDGDNVLPVDLDNALSVESFLGLVKPRKSVVLHEVFPDEASAPVDGRAGRHLAEIVVPFFAAREPEVERALPAAPAIRRSFAAGSEWLYAKIYSGPAMADAALREIVGPLVQRGRATGALEGWFFIRYADPHPHLRVRFRGAPERLRAEVLPALHARVEPWLASGRVHRLDFDTYVREVERYGGDRGIVLSEALFEHDSDVALGLARTFDGVSDGEARWRMAVAGMDRMLDDFGLDLAAKLELLTAVRNGFAEEHRVDARFDRELGSRFRGVRAELEHLLDGTGPAWASDEDALAITRSLGLLTARSDRSASAIQELTSLAKAGALGASFSDLVASHLHMHCNRMLAADHRAHELVLYDFLLRIYASRDARARRGPPGRVRHRV